MSSGDVRNDVYVTIESGEFERGPGKTSQKNVEVSMCVVGSNGRLIEVCVECVGQCDVCDAFSNVSSAIYNMLCTLIPVLHNRAIVYCALWLSAAPIGLHPWSYTHCSCPPLLSTGELFSSSRKRKFSERCEC